MPMKILGVCAGLLGLSMIVFAIITWRELRNAGSSNLAPTADSMPLTMFVYPEFFDAETPGEKPVDPAGRAQAVVNRIYMIGGFASALVVTGVVMLVLQQRPRLGQTSS